MKKTQLYEQHLRLGAKIAPFGGYEMPIQYESIIKEHEAARTKAAVFDTCHMGEFLIEGKSATSDLERLLSREITNMKIGTCRCAFLCNTTGGVIDDLILYRLANDKYMMVVNAAGQEEDFAWVKSHLSPNTKIQNISNETAKIDIHGPASAEILSKLLQDDIFSLKYFCFMETSYSTKKQRETEDRLKCKESIMLCKESIMLCKESIMLCKESIMLCKESIMLLISRTGYTGELGFEIYCPPNIVADIWNDCIALGATPAGLGARDTLRLEMGYPLYGHELSASRNAAQSGLTYAISANKEFIGSAAIFADAKEQVLCGIKLDGRRQARSGDTLKDSSGNDVGVITSGGFSPTLGYAIALGYVDSTFANVGTVLTVSIGKSAINCTVVDLPFYKQGTARRELS